MKCTATVRKTLILTTVATLTLTWGLATALAVDAPHTGMMQHNQTHTAMSAQGMGTIKKILADKAMVKLKHDPIAAIGWPAMTMNFSVAPSVNLSRFSKDQAVHFTLQMQADGSYLITTMMSMGDINQ